MSTWQEILNAAANGDQPIVEELLRFRLPLELRRPAARGRNDICTYEGPIVKAALNSFRNFATQSEQQLAESRVDDVVDYITDQIINKVGRTADLVSFCALYPDLDINSVAERFTGWNNLKRGRDEKIEWIKSNLGSMVKIGIALPADSMAVKESESIELNEIFGFEERARKKGLGF